ncbi:MAG: helix-turn-helix transcriptional regulator [Deltaproteobacteria bacterium]|nr:helix-turn-helix transcriptional regulator [Deltaproteobacteria bacterium]
MGSELGIDPATYQRWKAGTKVPSGKYLALVERFLGELQSGA